MPFPTQALSFECIRQLHLQTKGTSLEFLGQLRVSRSRLISRSRLQNDGSAQVCAPLEHSLIKQYLVVVVVVVILNSTKIKPIYN